MKRQVLGLLARAPIWLLAILAGPAAAQSFDCAKASDATETAVCNSDLLSAFDTELAHVYRAALSANNGEGASNLRTAQHQWIAQRNACGSDAACIGKAYRERIGSLTQTYDLFPGWAGTYDDALQGGLEIQITGTPDTGYKVDFLGAGANYTCGPVSGTATMTQGNLHGDFGDGMSIDAESVGTGLFVPDTQSNEDLQSENCGARAPELAGTFFVRSSD
ncbi:lysozyme inhibitor LprI family protein [Pelagibacterium halotolerans]|uniref:lysozyme inhibitor LprI family protein n=1 Tax=Pelagibacterium halotolerans TaxID=531813 RepID=UPI00384BE753